MAGSTLVPVGATWSTTMTGYGKSAGSDRTSATRASTPPADAPATTTAWPRGRAPASSGVPVTAEQHYSLPVGPTRGALAGMARRLPRGAEEAGREVLERGAGARLRGARLRREREHQAGGGGRRAAGATKASAPRHGTARRGEHGVL